MASDRDVIGIDASRLAVGERTGTETYTRELIMALGRLQSPERVRLYLNADEPTTGLPAGMEPVCIPFPRFWTHVRLSWEMTRRPPGVLFVPAHVVPLRHPRTVVTIHDLGYLHLPDAHPARQRRMLDLTTRWSVRAARHVIAISAQTRDDLIASYGVPPGKISVVPHGVRPTTPVDPAVARAARERLGVREPYVLAVGTVQPRKNLGRLAAAMAVVKAAGLPHRLVLAGKRGWLAEEVEREIAVSGAADRVDRLGYVADADLAALYAAARVVAFPSLFEGFGLPALEAMAAGVPVLAANRGALAETAGDAGLLVDPESTEAITAGLLSLLTEAEDARARRIARGRARASVFPWERTARETLEILRRVRDSC